MISFLKRFFKEEPLKQKKVLTLGQLESWLKEAEEKEERILVPEIKECKSAIESLKIEVSFLIEKLKSQELQNKNIPEKALHFMQGNRESYVRLVQGFLEGVPSLEGVNPKEANAYCGKFEKQIGVFAEASSKNYYVLQNFFALTLHDISQSIRKLENVLRDLKTKIEKSSLQPIFDAQVAIKRISALQEHKESLEESMKKAKVSEENALGKITIAKQHLTMFEEGESFLEGKKTMQEIEEKKRELQLEKGQVSSFFSPLEKALKKYSKMAFEHQDLIIKYSEYPSTALLEDKGLHLRVILEKVKKALEENELDLDGKRTQKALFAISLLTNERIESSLEKIERMEKEVFRLEEKMAQFKISETHDQLKKAMQECISEHEILVRQLKTLQEQAKAITLEKEKKELEKELKEKLNELIEVTVK